MTSYNLSLDALGTPQNLALGAYKFVISAAVKSRHTFDLQPRTGNVPPKSQPRPQVRLNRHPPPPPRLGIRRAHFKVFFADEFFLQLVSLRRSQPGEIADGETTAQIQIVVPRERQDPARLVGRVQRLRRDFAVGKLDTGGGIFFQGSHDERRNSKVSARRQDSRASCARSIRLR